MKRKLLRRIYGLVGVGMVVAGISLVGATYYVDPLYQAGNSSQLPGKTSPNGGNLRIWSKTSISLDQWVKP